MDESRPTFAFFTSPTSATKSRAAALSPDKAALHKQMLDKAFAKAAHALRNVAVPSTPISPRLAHELADALDPLTRHTSNHNDDTNADATRRLTADSADRDQQPGRSSPTASKLPAVPNRSSPPRSIAPGSAAAAAAAAAHARNSLANARRALVAPARVAAAAAGPSATRERAPLLALDDDADSTSGSLRPLVRSLSEWPLPPAPLGVTDVFFEQNDFAEHAAAVRVCSSAALGGSSTSSLLSRRVLASGDPGAYTRAARSIASSAANASNTSFSRIDAEDRRPRTSPMGAIRGGVGSACSSRARAGVPANATVDERHRAASSTPDVGIEVCGLSATQQSSPQKDKRSELRTRAGAPEPAGELGGEGVRGHSSSAPTTLRAQYMQLALARIESLQEHLRALQVSGTYDGVEAAIDGNIGDAASAEAGGARSFSRRPPRSPASAMGATLGAGRVPRKPSVAAALATRQSRISKEEGKAAPTSSAASRHGGATMGGAALQCRSVGPRVRRADPPTSPTELGLSLPRPELRVSVRF